MYLCEPQVSKPGIYAIFNCADLRIYIGQTNNLKSRAYQHQSDLKKSIEANTNLQKDYCDEKNLVFFCIEIVKDESLLTYYESLYCYIAQKHLGRDNSLYNGNKRYTDLSFVNNYSNIIKANDNLIKDKKKAFLKAIKDRFKSLPKLIATPSEQRKNIFDTYYKEIYPKKCHGFFDTDELQHQFGIDLISPKEVIGKKIIFTTIGAYLDQSIMSILEEKITDIQNNQYCVWALNKLNAETVRYFCTHDCDTNRIDSSTPIYLIMQYTDSTNNYTKHTPSDIAIATSERFCPKDVRKMQKEGLELNHSPVEELKMLEKNGDYYFPKTLKLKETCLPSKSCFFAKAFVIDKFYILDGNFKKETLFDFYNVYRRNDYEKNKRGQTTPLREASKSIKGQNDTGCLLLKDSITLNDTFFRNFYSDNLGTNYIVARLKLPFPFVQLQLDKTNSPIKRKRDI